MNSRIRREVGSAVTIRKDLNIHTLYNGVAVVEQMMRFAGKVVHISWSSIGAYEYDDCGYIYHLEEDLDKWSWCEGMFEDVQRETITPELAQSTIVISSSWLEMIGD